MTKRTTPKIYRLSLRQYGDANESTGYVYFATRAEAETAKRDQEDILDFESASAVPPEVESRPVPRAKAAVIRLLEDWGSHPDNG